MDASLRELYSRYVRATEYFNSDSGNGGKQAELRSTLGLKTLTEEEFPAWWSLVSRDKELQSRWLERFDDPAGYLNRTRLRISDELSRISIRQSAA